MNETYDRQQVEAVLERVGMPQDRRNTILEEIHFPIPLRALQNLLAPHGITHDHLIDRIGGSP